MHEWRSKGVRNRFASPEHWRRAEHRSGADAQQPALLRRSRFQVRLTASAQHYTHLGDRAQCLSGCYNALSLTMDWRGA
jgi:hypothetical protein